MFESNFPVDKLSVSYPVLWNGLKKIANRFNDKEKSSFFVELQNGYTDWKYRLFKMDQITLNVFLNCSLVSGELIE